MARPIVEVILNGKKLTGVLDTGAWRSYIRKEFVKGFPAFPVEPFETTISGQTVKTKKGYGISGIVKDSEKRGYKFSIITYPVKDLGEESGKKIDILFGAVALEDWGTVIDQTSISPKIDYTRLRRGVLVEL